ncbi:phage portal protein [Kitasatospora sp. NPDC001175]|uniref:phage portal protein n=1 Tax=Kitasatospora sp. NPDC001175 TaxID=3157103 RepID=UPI003D06B249
MPLDLDPLAWVRRLAEAHDRQMTQLQLWNAYYEGVQPLSYMAPELLMEVDDRMRQVVINWPQLVVDSLEERLDIEGFRLGGADQADRDLWDDIWQPNDLDEESQLAHVDALAMRRSYVIVGAGDSPGDPPVITVESPLQVYAERDPRTRQIVAALKRWQQPQADGGAEDFATLYLPEATIQLTRKGAGSDWEEIGRDEHRLGTVPVVALVNRARVADRDGVSELAAIVPLSDAACKIATDMMTAAEFHAMPRRWATGLADDDFKDPSGRPVSALSRIAGRVWATRGDSVKFGQFPEANLSNFHETINSLARLAASLSGLPPTYLGLATDNPPSADAIRAAEARLVKRAERRQRAFGGGWEQVMRLALLIRDGEVRPEAERMETIWRDPATPTYAQKADAVTKLFAAGLLPKEQAWEDMGYSAAQIARMRAMEDDALTRLTAADLHALSTAPNGPAAPIGSPTAQSTVSGWSADSADG